MTIYDEVYEIVVCTDLLDCGRKLISFADGALKEKNKSTIVKHFYKTLVEFAMVEYVFDFSNMPYMIFQGRNAVASFIFINLPSMQTPVKSLKNIKAFGEYVLKNYTAPIGAQISKSTIEEIMNYLDREYQFSMKIFKDKKALFLLIDNSHIELNNECFIGYSYEKKLIQQHLFLYHMSTDGSDVPTPESVFFHELGHAVQARLTGTSKSLPPNILAFLKDLCFSKIDTLPPEKQCEIFADVISVALMYDSPFAHYDPFTYMHVDDKKAFKTLLKKIMDHIAL